jgi:hypothetical protein
VADRDTAGNLALASPDCKKGIRGVEIKIYYLPFIRRPSCEWKGHRRVGARDMSQLGEAHGLVTLHSFWTGDFPYSAKPAFLNPTKKP